MTGPLLLAAALALAAAPPAPARDPASLVLIVASNRGVQGGRPPLHYADDDGAKYHEVLSAIAGEENTLLLTDLDRDTARLFPALLEKARSPTRAQLDLAAAKLARRAAEWRSAGRAVRFHFVFAGHGDVDDGRGFLELADGPFTADDLQALIRTVDASEAHVILDSCNSFFVVNPRKPGGVRFATPRDAAELLARRLPNVGVFLSTSAKAEVYEWSELQSGIFSHAVRSGLMGAADVDGDGHVTYEELGGFVQTAVADIKNPLFRPTVYARGPNGEDARAILDVRGASRSLLTLDDGGAVRLSARDADGLRWIDVYKEAGGALTLWFPPALAGRLEIDRHGAGPADRGQVEASFALPSSDAPVALASLTPSGSALAMRGPGEIFQALFSRPFGPVALAAYLGQREALAEAALAPLVEDRPGRSDPAPQRAALARRIEAPRRFFAVLRPGAILPWFARSGSSLSSPGPTGGPSLTFAVGREVNPFFAAEIEAGYQEVGSSGWTYVYPSSWQGRLRIPGTSFRFQMAPVSLTARFQLPLEAARPYVLLGAGVVPTQVTIDPPDFNATLRATRYVPLAHAGAGVVFDVGDRFLAGVEARFFATPSFGIYGESRVGLLGVSAAALVGARL